MGRLGGKQVRYKANAKCDPSVVLQLALDGQADQAIAANVGVTPGRISQVLRPWRGLIKLHAAGAHKLADGGTGEMAALAAARGGILQNLVDPDRLAKATTHALAISYEKLFHASRLLEGKTTSNVGLRASIIIEAHKELEASPTPALTLRLEASDEQVGLEREAKGGDEPGLA